MEKKDIRLNTVSELEAILVELGQPKFRAKQVYEWLWYKGATSFEGMRNLPKSLLEVLDKNYFIPVTKIYAKQESIDGTIKLGFELSDGNKVEGVIIPSNGRYTACISSQVGCSLDCKFCATGFLKRERNLTAGEIYDQVKIINDITTESYGQKIDNIVYMGMGEPLLNYVNVVQSIKYLIDMKGLGFSGRRITVSTAGISKMIIKLADEELGCKLALSLHEANDEARSKIMPINDSNPLDSLSEALIYWYNTTKSRPTLEYTVIEGVNDTQKSRENLAVFAKKFPCKINLIEYNPIAQATFKPTETDNLLAFAEGLEKEKLIVNVRRSRGKDIDAACGQLITND
jgi:23S rRNA (adenine2503-C2)-methyltransferase